MAEPVAAESKYYLHGADPEELVRWWATLDKNRGVRARLRRVERPDDALLSSGFFQFLSYMPERWSKPEHLYASALVATALAQVAENAGGYQSFAGQLGAGEQPVMSELRFKQLINSRTPEEFFRRLLRAIRLLKRTVNVISLSEGVLQWYDEYSKGPDRNPVNRLSVKWAGDYYLPGRNKTEADS